MRARGTGREIPALLACLVWIGGFEVAPFLHVVDHATLAPHAHVGGSPTHCHGEGCHEHVDAAHEGAANEGAANEGAANEAAGDAPDPEHGDGALAHRGLAAHTAPPALPPIRAPLIGTAWASPTTPPANDSPSRERPRARAPPHRLSSPSA